MNAAEFVLNLIDQPDDLLPLLGSILLLYCAGSKMVEGRLDLRVVGCRAAAGVFFAYILSGYVRFNPEDAGELLGIIARGLLAGAAALGWSWIVLAVFAFLHQNTIGRYRSWREEMERQRRYEQVRIEAELHRSNEEAAFRSQRDQLNNVVVVPRSEQIRQGLHQAKTDYDTECSALRGAGLDEDELEFALGQARTKYVRTLKGVMQ